MSETITVNVEKETALEFRKMVIIKYGKKKGSLGKALTEAMMEWAKKEDIEIVNQGIGLLNKGIEGKKWKFNRDDLHER